MSTADAQRTRRRGGAEGATVTSRRRQSGDSMAARLRGHAVPHARMAAVAAAGTGAQLAGTVAGAPTTVAAVTTLAGAAAVGLAAVARRHRSRMTGREVCGWLAASGWCGWVAAAGWSPAAALALCGAGVAGHLRWWRDRRIPDPPPVTAPEPEPVDRADPATLWAEHIGSSGGALPGSTLSGEERIDTGRRYLVHLRPGRQSLSTALGAVPQLRTGLRLYPWQDLAVERHPATDEATVRLTIVERSPVLSTDQLWPGDTYDPADGSVAVGPYTDGEGTAAWRVHTSDSLWGGYITGSTGTGKSRTMESVALGLATAGVVVWYVDGQDGSSSPYLAEHADWSLYGTDGVRTMLEAAQRVKRARQLQNRLERWTGWRPDQHRPGLMIFVDECHVPMADRRCQALATELAREGRKVGIALIMASQTATLDAFGGTGSDALRSSVCAGNVLLMRSLSNATRVVLPGVDVDPTQFPSIAGYAHLVDYSGTRRSAPCRSYWLDDSTIAAAAARVTWAELDQQSASAAGADYLRRREDDGVDAQLAAELAALTAGLTAPAAVTAGPSVPVSPAVPTFPAPVPPQSTGGPKSDRGDDGDQGAGWVRLSPAAERVRDALAEGPLSPGQLRQATGYSQTRVRQAAAELVAAGLAQRDGARGPWSLVDRPELAASHR